MENIDNQPAKTKKDMFLERLRAKNPDIDTNDEEQLYGTIGDNYDNFERYRTERDNVDKMMGDRFNSDKRFGQFFLGAIQEGSNPIAELVKVYGEDIREYLDNPDNADELNKAQQEKLSKMADAEKSEGQYSENLKTSFELLDQFQQENSLTDDQADEIFTALVSDAENIILGNFSADMFSAKMKALNYDKDIEATKHDAYVEGKNEKIMEKKKATQVNDNVPPMLTGKRASVRKGEDVAKAMGEMNDRYDTMKGAIRTPARRNR